MSKELYTALFNARRQFMPLKKSGFNPHFNSNFSTITDIEAATAVALDAHGLLLNDTCELIEANGQLVHVVKTYLYHVESATFIFAVSPLSGKDAQKCGADQTYRIRQHRQRLLGISSGDIDVDGNDDAQLTSSAKASGKPPSASKFIPKGKTSLPPKAVSSKPADPSGDDDY